VSQKIEALESLRGIGALTVLIGHLLLAFYPAMVFEGHELHFGYENTIRVSPVHLLYNGSFAVCLFFALSGYVLSHNYFTTRDIETLKSSAYRRYFRLMVPVFAAVMISFVIGSFGLYRNMEIVAVTDCYGWLDTMLQFPRGDIFGAIYSGLFGVFIFGDGRYDNSLWTMATEFRGSFLVYGFLFVLGDRWERIFAYVIAFLLFKNGYMISFLAGMAVCDLSTTMKYKIPEVICIGITMLGLWIAAVSFDVNSLFSIIGLHIGTDYPNLICGSILVLAGVAFSPSLKKILSNSFMVWMGKMSFSVYVIHLIIICSYSCITFSLLNQIISYNVAAIVTIVSSIVLVYLIATYFYRWFDLGGQRISKALSKTSYEQVSFLTKKVTMTLRHIIRVVLE
jgi:peptidoglycan/LPS O-acetylase OafA/YrhL